jgi:putative nucleotidyltransferase with HDIG domain
MAHVLIVDDEPDLRELLGLILGALGHTTDEASNGEEGCRRVGQREYDLIISDIRMPGMSGLEFLRRVQPSIESRTPCMIVTALADEVESAVEAVRVGACNFLSKPFHIPEIRAAVERALDLRQAYRFRHDYRQHLETKLREKEQQLQETYDGTIVGFASLLEGKDTSTREHCTRVKDYCVTLARAVGIPEEEMRNVVLGSLLHDIGKFRVPDAILLKRGPLTAEEWEVMRQHPNYGAEVLREIPFLAGARDIVQSHHERFDGTGYPQGLAGEDIPIAARVFSLVDAFDAITEKRCYKQEQPPEFALDELRRCAGTQFDPMVVDAFEGAFEDILEVRRQSRVRAADPRAWLLDHPPARNGVNGSQNGHETVERERLAIPKELGRRLGFEERTRSA